jgi:hypothetical protein
VYVMDGGDGEVDEDGMMVFLENVARRGRGCGGLDRSGM